MRRALLWKSWRELRTAALAGLAWMLLCAAYVLFYEWQHPLRAPIARLFTSALLFQWFAGTCLAVLVTQRERWERSLRFTRSLPVSLSKAAAARMGVAVAALAVPVMVAAMIVAVPLVGGWIEQAGERATYRDTAMGEGSRLTERPALSSAAAIEFFVRALAINLASGVQFLLLLSILGNFVRSEKTVGFFGVVFSLVFLISMGSVRQTGFESVWLGLLPPTMAACWSYGWLEGTSYDDLDLVRNVWPALTLNLVVLGSLLWVFAKTYGYREAVQAPPRRWKLAMPVGWLRGAIPQIRTPLGSLVWLTLRQSVPLAVSGLIVALLMAMTEIQVLGSTVDLSAMKLALNLGGTTWFIGMAWSVIVAAGVFSSELQPRLARFWSSRPIAPAQWLLVKYLTGLAAVLLVIDGTAIIVGFIGHALTHSAQPLVYGEMCWSYIAVIPLQHAMLYSLGVAAVIATRSGVFGAAAALGGFTIFTVATQFVPGWFYRDEIEVYNDLIDDEIKGSLDLWQHGYPGVAIWSVALILLLYAFARRRLQRQLRAAY